MFDVRRRGMHSKRAPLTVERRRPSVRSQAQIDIKTTALPQGRMHANGPAHSFHTLPDDGEAKGRSGKSFGSVEAVKEAENSLMMGGVDADAVILDEEVRVSSQSLGPDLNFRFGVDVDKFESVRD